MGKIRVVKDELIEKLKAELGIEEEKKQEPVKIATLASPVHSDKPSKPGKQKPRSKKYQEKLVDLDRSKTYPLTEAIDLVKKLSYSKFDGTMEAHINTIQTGIRGLVTLPHAAGKKLRILSFEGDDSVIDNIIKGKIDFDILITTPAAMPKLAKVAKFLGPRGLMPNPKNGTITDDLKKAAESFQQGKTEYEHSSKQVYKTEAKAPVMHLALGKLNQPDQELIANVKQLIMTIGKTKIKKVSLSPTMGPSVRLDLGSI